jgi:flagellar hook-basal body complex protein FliE
MPIEGIAGIAGPLAGAFQPRVGGAHEVHGAVMDAMAGLGKSAAGEASEPAGATFGKILQNAIGEVNKAQLHAGDLSTRFAAGEPMDVHQVMIASQEASVALNLAIQVRNKLVDGYQELMRVNV